MSGQSGMKKYHEKPILDIDIINTFMQDTLARVFLGGCPQYTPTACIPSRRPLYDARVWARYRLDSSNSTNLELAFVPDENKTKRTY